MKMSSSYIRRLHCLWTLLLVLLIDQVSSQNEPAAASGVEPSTTATSVYYNLEVDVSVIEGKKDESQVTDWLGQVLESGLDSCVSPLKETTLTGVYQGIEVSCNGKNNIKNAKCDVTVQLRDSVSACCILRTLCAASETSADITVVGTKANRVVPVGQDCSTSPEDSCVYKDNGRSSCEMSESYVSGDSNCDTEPGCSCSVYCSGKDTYYTMEIKILSTKARSSVDSSQLSNVRARSTSGSGSDCTGDFPNCQLSTVYKDSKLFCEDPTATHQNCKMIFVLTQETPICEVSAFMISRYQSLAQISFDGVVKRVAICGTFGDPLKDTPDHPVVWHNGTARRDVCSANSAPFTCDKTKTVIVDLEEECLWEPTTTVSPQTNSTTNTTTSGQMSTTPRHNTTVTTNNTTSVSTTNMTTANTTVMTTTQSAESRANELLALTENLASLNSSQVDDLVFQLEVILSGSISLALANISIQIVSNLLGAPPEKVASSSREIIGIVDTVGEKLILEERTETILASSLALSVKPADGASFQETLFSIADPSTVQVRGDASVRRSRADSSIPQGSITLPSTITQNLNNEQKQQLSRVHFNFYQRSTVFQDKKLGKRKLNSGILGASVGNLSISGLTDDVVFELRNDRPVPENASVQCVFWDFSSNNGSGGWSSDGCSVLNSTDNTTVCGCNHLTSFAILLDLSRGTLTDPLQATILTFITYIGCGISAIFLSITILTYLAFEKLRKDIPSKILIQLCVALLLLNLVFLVDAWLALYPNAVGLCISTAWFLHYFLLVAFSWMGLEAVHMYVALVKVFNSHMSHYMLRLSSAGWGIPMIVVIVVIAVDKDNYGLVSYGRFPDGTTDEFCWLKNDIAFYVAVVAYFCAIFLFNCVMFVVVLVQLCRVKRQNPHNAQHRTTIQDVRSVVGITILLGLTWGFAFFAWGPVNLAFMYLFAIFNSLQGFFIFIFHCAVKENVRRQWRIYLCCGKMRLAENSEWSRTATQKTMKKSSVSRLTSLPSSRSFQSNHSSSSSFLVNDTSEQTSGIGSTIDDRTITADEEPSTDVVLNDMNMQHRHDNSS